MSNAGFEWSLQVFASSWSRIGWQGEGPREGKVISLPESSKLSPDLSCAVGQELRVLLSYSSLILAQVSVNLPPALGTTLILAGAVNTLCQNTGHLGGPSISSECLGAEPSQDRAAT